MPHWATERFDGLAAEFQHSALRCQVPLEDADVAAHRGQGAGQWEDDVLEEGEEEEEEELEEI